MWTFLSEMAAKRLRRDVDLSRYRKRVTDLQQKLQEARASAAAISNDYEKVSQECEQLRQRVADLQRESRQQLVRQLVVALVVSRADMEIRDLWVEAATIADAGGELW